MGLRFAKPEASMLAYLLRRVLLIVPTVFGIMLVSFVIVQFAPGGPVERMIAQLTGNETGATDRFSGGGGDLGGQAQQSFNQDPGSQYRGARGLDPEFIKSLEKQYGFDKPAYERFWKMIWDYSRFDFGESYFRNASVLSLIGEKLPVSISLGLWVTLLSYLISIPLGIRKAMHEGSRFDLWTSAVVIVGYAIPGFLFAVLLVTLFAGGSFWQIFPLQGLVSSDWSSLPLWQKVTDYLWHMVLPLSAMVLSAFAMLTLLTKNSFLDEIRKQYVLTARMKGLTPHQVLYGHVFRNAMLIIIAGFPGAFISAFFSGSLLIEMIFNLDGLGLLGWESVIKRDYPVVFASLFIFSLLGLAVNLISDITYMLVDPRIDFDARES
jgi:microcin C transport system permease protein